MQQQSNTPIFTPIYPYSQAMESQLLKLCTHTTSELTQLHPLPTTASINQDSQPQDTRHTLFPPSTDREASHTYSSGDSHTHSTEASYTHSSSLLSINEGLSLQQQQHETSLPHSNDTHRSQHTAGTHTPSLALCSDAVKSCVAVLVSLTHISLAGNGSEEGSNNSPLHRLSSTADKPISRQRSSTETHSSSSSSSSNNKSKSSGSNSKNSISNSSFTPSPLTLTALTHCCATAARAGMCVSMCLFVVLCLSRVWKTVILPI